MIWFAQWVCTWYIGLRPLQLYGANFHLQIQFVLQIMHQNIATILWENKFYNIGPWQPAFFATYEY